MCVCKNQVQIGLILFVVKSSVSFSLLNCVTFMFIKMAVNKLFIYISHVLAIFIHHDLIFFSFNLCRLLLNLV